MKEILFIVCFLFTISLIGQDTRIRLIGKIESDSIPVENAHIINLNSNMGTVSNEKGYFKISVKQNDILQISEISYKTKMILINKVHTKAKTFVVNLQINVNELDEVIIDKNQFTKGINATTFILPNAGKNPLDQNERKLNYYSQKSTPMVFFESLILNPILYIIPYPYKKPPPKGGIEDIYNIISGNRKEHKKLKELLDADKLKEFTLIEIHKIRAHFRDDFFIKNLELPKDKIDLFIEYCISKKIVYLFNDKRYVEMIDFFIKEIDNFNLNTLQLE